MDFEIQRLKENKNATYSGVLRPGYLAKHDFFHKIFVIATIYTKYGVKVKFAELKFSN